MTEQEKINGWTFEETVKIAENLMEVEKNMFKWDVLRHLRDFAENFKEELKQYRAIGTPEECRSAVEKQKAKKVLKPLTSYSLGTCPVCTGHQLGRWEHCMACGQKLDWSDVE